MQLTSTNKKVILAGNYGAGISTIQSIIFSQSFNLKTFNPDMDFESKFLQGLPVKFWHLDSFLQDTEDLELSFKGIEVFVHVLDASNFQATKSIKGLKRCFQILSKFSPQAKIFVLANQIDKVDPEEKDQIFEKMKEEILNAELEQGVKIQEILATSIWDDTLYYAWSQIAQSLTSEYNLIKNIPKQIASNCDYDEVILLDKKTFLLIAAHGKESNDKGSRCERMSLCLKLFRLSCMKSDANFKSMFFKRDKNYVFVDEFTQDTSIVVIVSDPKITQAAIKLSIDGARKQLKKKIKRKIGQNSTASN